MKLRDFSGRRRATDGLPGWVIVALPALALVSVLLAARTAGATREAAEQDLVRVRRETDEARARLATLRRDASRGGTRELSRTAAPGRVLATLAATVPEDVRLDTVVLSYATDVRLQMQVHATSPAAWDAFLQQLAVHPRFAGVAPGEETREGTVKASVGAAWKP